MKKRIVNLSLLVTLIIVTGCSSSPATPDNIPSGIQVSYVAPVQPSGEPEIRALEPAIQPIRNCSGINEPVVGHPASVVATSNGVEWETGGVIGVGIKIGEGVVPAGVDLSTALEGKLASDINVSIQNGLAWDLPAPPNTIVYYTLLWKETWQKGFVEVYYSDNSVVYVNVWYRTGITSEIIDERVETCGGETSTDITQPTLVIVEPAPRSEIGSSGAAWVENINGLPVIGTSITWEMKMNQVFVLTGGRIQYQDFYCGDDRYQICVLIIKITSDSNVTATSLITKNNWLGVTDFFSPEETLTDIQNWFWKPPNCGSGCRLATVAFFEDTSLVEKRTITAP